ncbi:Rne/Rng family ribonuclease [Gulosibacter sp. 10]|uniref:Rne/Rng family ribonuclease n=1 Tax=Gulosibacter sp. 10 TaxID=1255570 RepID=UPI00097F2218|nr:Rne/Rng family ribonuclease [Gulosibacter sp. 10]SJM61900.1 Cytoplasmic axial filament protein CafA and Ribonuclease G [Gulosibacter sp. 10]
MTSENATAQNSADEAEQPREEQQAGRDGRREAAAESPESGAAQADGAAQPQAGEDEAREAAEDSTEAPEPADAGPAEDEQEAQPERDPRIPEVITKRTLFFLAPDLPPVTERGASRPAREEPEDDSEEQDDDSRRGRGRGRSRRGGRSGGRGQRDDRDRRQQDRRDERDAEEQGDDEDGPEPITEPQKVHGSTRLAAKRQRRREGRDTGRRRTVVTESEFQARRESVDRKMIVRAKSNRVQLGVLEDGILVEHYVARNEDVSLIGNVYLGRVQNVLPSMEAAFVDIGGARNAVLYSGEVDWSAANLGHNAPRKIENALKSGDRVLVQVTKDPVGHKGARLTSQVSLPGRYLVYVPGNTMNGISRKLPDTERSRLKKILKQVLPEGVGVIVRTAAEGATEEQLRRDVERLTKQWEDIQRKAKATTKAPQTLHSESDMLIKIVRDVFNEDFDELIVQGQSELDTIKSYLGQVAPDLLDRVRRYDGQEQDIFAEYRVDDMIDKALGRKVWLPSGGSLVIDRTEAMTVIDVNTGKFVGTGGNLEETVTKNNLEAAEEIVRQLRLRDIGGIIVIDFIDMVLESNRDLVQRRLIEGLSRDRTKHQVAEVTSLGLVQMTRKKIGLGLLETFSEPCSQCDGRGVVVHGEPVSHNHGGGSGGRKGRGSRSRGKNGQQEQKQQHRQSDSGQNGNGNGTHEITEDARNALTKIAASLVAHGAEESAEQVQAAADQVAAAEASGREKSGKGDRVGAEDKSGKDESGSQDSGSNGRGSRGKRSRRNRGGQDRAGQERGGQDRDEQPRGDSDAQQPRSEERTKPAAEQSGTEQSGAVQAGDGRQAPAEQESKSSERGSRRSRRNRRVRVDTTSTSGGSAEAEPRESARSAESAAQSAPEREESITIDLPEPREAAPAAPEERDPKQVEEALHSLDALLDALVEPGEEDAEQVEEQSAEPETEVQAVEEQASETPAAEVQAAETPAAEVQAAETPAVEAPASGREPAEEAPESRPAATSSRRKRGARRRITTGPISTGPDGDA